MVLTREGTGLKTCLQPCLSRPVQQQHWFLSSVSLNHLNLHTQTLPPPAKEHTQQKVHKRALLIDTNMTAEETTDVELEDPGLNTGPDIGLSFLICRVEIKPAQPPLYDCKAPMGEWM